MRRVTCSFLILILSATACATSTFRGEEPGSGLPTAPPESLAAELHDPTTDTFDGWIMAGRERRHVFVGTLTEIVDDEPWEKEGLLTVLMRELRFMVRDVIKGTLEPGDETSVFQSELHGERVRLLRSDIGRDVLVVAQAIPLLRSADGSRNHPNALAMIEDATYVKMTDPDGRIVGVRLVSPAATRFGYDGARTTLEQRLSLRLPLRLADVSPWEALLERAANPRLVREEQLGYEEFARSNSDPLEYDYGDPDPDDSEDP